MHIYSDHLNQMLKLPDFQIENDEFIMFDSMSIPCKDEIILTLAHLESTDAHHTIRVPCNNATIG